MNSSQTFANSIKVSDIDQGDKPLKSTNNLYSDEHNLDNRKSDKKSMPLSKVDPLIEEVV